jgi:hypothetical protein
MPPVALRNLETMEWKALNQGLPNAVFIKQINRDPVTGALLWLINEPPGFEGSGNGAAHYLPVDEEALFLEGTMVGDPETTYVAGDYVFFPMGFLHSPNDGTTTGALIVMRLSGPMSYVNIPVPEGETWTRAHERQMIPGQLNSRRPISRLATADLPWEDLRLDGEPTGERIKLLSTDRRTGACSFLASPGPRWHSPHGSWTSASTREWLVLEGSLEQGEPEPVTLGRLAYRCAAAGSPIGPAHTRAGYVALCWSDGPLDHREAGGRARTVGLG